jgi:hypothetical protein
VPILNLDIETVRDPLNPGREPEGDRLPAAPHHLVVAACAVVLTMRSEHSVLDGGEDQAPPCNERKARRADFDVWHEATQALVFGHGSVDERTILEHVAEAMDRKPHPRIKTWAGDGFDLPVIRAGMMAHGIQCPWLFHNDVTNRYRDGHRDLMDELCSRNAGPRWSLHGTARRLGLPGKLDVDGSNVAEMHAAGRHEEIRAYCLCDCWQLTAVGLRLELSSGGLSVDGYRRSAASLCALAAATEALRPILASDRFDRKRFLMEEA